ncbi:MAG: signal peptidase II [Candidatus Aceula meridiana]|nr:signal peptidase II [Candidatus Aceula meridiana]
MTHSQKAAFIATFTVFTVVIFDRISKVFFSHILSLGESIPVIRNIFHVTLVHNTGIAFGFFKSYGILFVFISLAAIVLFIFYLYRNRHYGQLRLIETFAFSLIVSGAIGNLIDRLSFGYVVDFIDFRFWPVFNVADSAITIGTIIVLIKCIPFFSK